MLRFDLIRKSAFVGKRFRAHIIWVVVRHDIIVGSWRRELEDWWCRLVINYGSREYSMSGVSLDF